MLSVDIPFMLLIITILVLYRCPGESLVLLTVACTKPSPDLVCSLVPVYAIQVPGMHTCEL
jgi:hypothetical protein